MSAQYDHVSVVKKSNVYFGGLCISHTVQFGEALLHKDLKDNTLLI